MGEGRVTANSRKSCTSDVSILRGHWKKSSKSRYNRAKFPVHFPAPACPGITHDWCRKITPYTFSGNVQDFRPIHVL